MTEGSAISEGRPSGLAAGPIYLDYNATTPVDPVVLDAMLPFWTGHFGNPSSSHGYGTAARDGVERARDQVAALLGAPAGSSVVFTGSGSEADALAIRGVVLGSTRGVRGAHVITQVTEHPAVLAAFDYLRELHGVRVTVLPVDGAGRVDPLAVADALTDDTVLVSVMHANNETGTIQPIGEIARLAHARGALVHCDAAQSVGKVDVDVTTLGVDLLTVVGHKVYAPKGIAALYVGPGVPLRPVVDGGGQEGGRRAGTENVAYAVGLGVASKLAAQGVSSGEPARLELLRDRLHRGLEERLPGRVRPRDATVDGLASDCTSGKVLPGGHPVRCGIGLERARDGLAVGRSIQQRLESQRHERPTLGRGLDRHRGARAVVAA